MRQRLQNRLKHVQKDVMKIVVIYVFYFFSVLIFRAQKVFRSCNVKEIHDCLVTLFSSRSKTLYIILFNFGILLRPLHTSWQPCYALKDEHDL